MNIRPLGAMVLIKPIDTPTDYTVNGILIRESHDDVGNQAEVLSVGDRVENVAIGDVVLYDSRSQSLSPCTMKGERFILIGEHDLLAIMESE